MIAQLTASAYALLAAILFIGALLARHKRSST